LAEGEQPLAATAAVSGARLHANDMHYNSASRVISTMGSTVRALVAFAGPLINTRMYMRSGMQNKPVPQESIQVLALSKCGGIPPVPTTHAATPRGTHTNTVPNVANLSRGALERICFLQRRWVVTF